MVDKTIALEKFSDILVPDFQQQMRDRNVVFIRNRSFTSYCGMTEIENDFKVPLFGSRNMLRMEDREEEQDYYWLLKEAGLPFPEKINGYEEIDCLSIVKLHHAEKKLERGFFTCLIPRSSSKLYFRGW